MKFKQICVGQWEGGSGLTFSVVALGEDGKVYKHTTKGWEELADRGRGGRVTRMDLQSRPERNEDPF